MAELEYLEEQDTQWKPPTDAIATSNDKSWKPPTDAVEKKNQVGNDLKNGTSYTSQSSSSSTSDVRSGSIFADNTFFKNMGKQTTPELQQRHDEINQNLKRANTPAITPLQKFDQMAAPILGFNRDLVQSINPKKVAEIDHDVNGHWGNIIQNVFAKIEKTGTDIAHGTLSLINDAEQLKNPVKMRGTPMDELIAGLNGNKKRMDSVIQNNQLPNTFLGNTIDALASIAPDIAGSMVAPEAKVAQGAGLLAKAGGLLFNKFTNYLVGKGIVTNYGAAKEQGSTEGQAAVQALKGGAEGAKQGIELAILGAGSGLATKSIMAKAESMGLAGAKAMAIRQLVNLSTDLVAYGLVQPTVNAAEEGRFATSKEIAEGMGIAAAFRIKGGAEELKSHSKLNKSIEETQNQRQGVAISNFVDADHEAIKQVYDQPETAQELNLQALDAAKKAKETTDLSKKQEYVAKAITFTKASNVKSVSDMVLNNPQGLEDFKNSPDIPDQIKQQFLQKAQEVTDLLKPKEDVPRTTVSDRNIPTQGQPEQITNPIELSPEITKTEEPLPSTEIEKSSENVKNILGVSSEDADALSIIYNADLTSIEKKILYRQYNNGVMNLNDVKNHAGVIDYNKLNSEDIGKWARAALEKNKSKNGEISAEDIDFEDIPKQTPSTVKSEGLDYRGKHQIKEPTTTANDLSGNGTGFDWDNVANDHDLSDPATKESYRILKTIKDTPDAEVTIYRSVPKGTDKINEGDWVTLSKTYAKEHGMHESDASQDMPVISMKVKAKDIGWDGNDLNEFSYNPKNETIQDKVQQPTETKITTTEKVSEVIEPTKTSETRTENIEPPKPPTEPPTVEDSGEETFGSKVRSFYKQVVSRSNGLTTEQKELLKNDPAALYNTLPHAESRRIAKELIEEIGVEEAVLEASKKNSGLAPVERTMLLGAAMDYYAGLAKEQAKSGNEKGLLKAAENEIDAQEKMLQVAAELATLGTDYGRAISAFKDIYKLSNLALERKLINKVAEVNEARNKDATSEAKDIQKIVTEEADAVQGAAKDLTDTELLKAEDNGRKISELEKEVADLKKQILERDNAAKGTKKNPLKIKRITNDTEYDKRLKDFQQRHRSIIAKDDITDLTYFGLYHIENGITKFADWYKVMASKFRGFKDNLKDIYGSVREKAIENGTDEKLFDTEEGIEKSLAEFQQESDAKKMVRATKKLADTELRKVEENNPDKARIVAPKKAAERIRQDAARNLDMPSTKVEQTYLKKLVQTINQKAKEYYKETKQNVRNINDILAFAIANNKADYKIWDRTKEEVERQINEDTSLTDEQKADVKEFLEDYTESVFDTLLTKNQIDQTIREKLIEGGYAIEKTVNGKVIKSVDWNKIIGNAKNIKDAKEKIVAAINKLGFTDKEAKGEINAILDQFDAKLTDKKTADINAYLNKGVINKVKSALGKKKATKSQTAKLIEMNNKGMLDDTRIKDVLAQELGLISLSTQDLARVRELSTIIDNPDIPEFMRKQFEEQMQYMFDSKDGNLMYLENRESVMANRLSSVYNQVQNATGFLRTVSTFLTVAAKTGKPIVAAKVYLKELFNSLADAKTILLRGRVSRGSAFSDLTRSTEGEARVRYLEQGKGKFLGGKFLGKPVYAKLGNKTVDLNPLNQAYSKVKYIQRLLEAVDTPSSSSVSGMTQFWQTNKLINKYYPELSGKEKSQKVWDIMYSLDRTTEVPTAIQILKNAGVENPTKSEINRTINERVERARNELVSKEFYKQVESIKPIAETKLKDDGIANPTAEQIQDEAYKILGSDQPLDVVARGERQAGRETGKTTTFGITSIILVPVDAIQKRLSNELRQNTTQSGKALSNSADAAFSQLFPFVHSIARWTEMQLELTPYGALKGLAYKSGLAKAVEGAHKAKFSKQEYSELGDDYMIRSVLGAGYTAAGMFGIGLAKSLMGDYDEAEDAITGTSKNKQFTQEKVESVGKPKQSVKIGGHNLPLQLLGNEGIIIGMYADYLDKRKDPEYAERGMMYISGLVAMNSILDATWFSNASRYGGIASAIGKGKEDTYMPGLGKIVGSAIGSQIPFSRMQTEAATVMNPKSQASKDFGVNLLNQMSIVRAFATDKPNFDYRGRTYDYGDIYVNSADGVKKMFSKAKYGDKADEFLAKINFAATDAYRETKEADSYKYAITKNDGTKRFMTADEYYEFKLKTGKRFDQEILEQYEKIDKIEIKNANAIDPIETAKTKKQVVSDILNKAKEESFKSIQNDTGKQFKKDKKTAEEVKESRQVKKVRNIFKAQF